MDDTYQDMPADKEHRMSTADLANASESIARNTDPAASAEVSTAPLLPEKEVADLRNRWNEIQTGFVDEPRKAVEDADMLVAEAMQRLAEIFASERSQLEAQWDRGDNVSTEDLRIALTRYRSFFGRLLSL
jgi:hypothetical protein